MEKTPVSVSEFGEEVSKTAPMPLYQNQKKEKTAYDYFQILGDSLAASIKNGTSPLLPNKDGFVDLKPAYNINTNTKAEGLTQLMLLEKQAELKAPTAAFVTFATVKKAQNAGVDCKVLKGSKGIQIPIVERTNDNGFEIKAANNWFNISQIENPEKLIQFCKDEMTKKYEEKVEYINTTYPNSSYQEKKNPAERDFEKPNEKIVPLNEKTTEAYQYLGQLLNAVQSNRKLYVTPEQATLFQKKAEQVLTAEYEPGKKDILAIKKLTDSAERLYKKNKEYLKEYYQKQSQKKGHKVEQKQERKISREPEYSRER